MKFNVLNYIKKMSKQPNYSEYMKINKIDTDNNQEILFLDSNLNMLEERNDIQPLSDTDFKTQINDQIEEDLFSEGVFDEFKTLVDSLEGNYKRKYDNVLILQQDYSEYDSNKSFSPDSKHKDFSKTKINEKRLNSYVDFSSIAEDRQIKRRLDTDKYTEPGIKVSYPDAELYKQYINLIKYSSPERAKQLFPIITNKKDNLYEFLGFVEIKNAFTPLQTLVDIKINYDKKNIPFLYGILISEVFKIFGIFYFDYVLSDNLLLSEVLYKKLKCNAEPYGFKYGYLSNDIMERFKEIRFSHLGYKKDKNQVIYPKDLTNKEILDQKIDFNRRL